MLAVVERSPGRATLTQEPVADYLSKLDAARARALSDRTRLLRRLPAGGPFVDPPFEPVPGEPTLMQLLVDYDVETHRVVFGLRASTWLLVRAFLDSGQDAVRRELAVAVLHWHQPALP